MVGPIFRLEGFIGCPKIFDCLDQFIDILVTVSDEESSSSSDTTKKTLLDAIKEFLGTQVTESHTQRERAKKLMLNSLYGEEIFVTFWMYTMKYTKETAAAFVRWK